MQGKIKNILRIVIALIVTSFVAINSYIYAQASAKEETVGFTTKEVRVVDGDTIAITKGNKKWNIRLQGIDAPESKQTCINKVDNKVWDCGIESGEALRKELALCNVKNKCCVTIIGTDKYGRSIGFVKIGEGKDTIDINQHMVRSGWAVAYRQYLTAYVNDEDKAHIEKKGIWSSEFAMPSDFRHAKKKTSKSFKEDL
ncbi:micrococcal nuclease [Gammaproteobacteria bacterium]